MDIFGEIKSALRKLSQDNAVHEPKKAVEMLVQRMFAGRELGNATMDEYELKSDEKWITTKKGHHVVINTKTKEVVFGPKHVMESIGGGAKSGLVDWATVSKTERWARAVNGMKGAGQITARNLVDGLLEKLTARMFSALPANRKAGVAEQAIGIIGAYLHNFGSEGISKDVITKAQKTIGEAVPAIKRQWAEFFDPSFYDSVVAHHTDTTQMQELRSRDIRDIVRASDAVYMPDEAKQLKKRIDEAIAKYGDIDALRSARERVLAIATGRIIDNSDDGKRVFTAMEDPVFPTSLDELVELPTPASFNKGYTSPKLFVDRSGKKWVLKGGGSEGHAQAEHEASEVYRKLGIPSPASKMYGNKRLAEYIEGTELGEYMRNATPEERKRVVDELRANFAADIILGNHDLIGDEEDNIMIGEDGRVWRIDNGGSLGKKGAGEDDDSFRDGWIDDLWTMRGMSPRVDGDMSNVPSNPQLKKYFGMMETNDILEAAAAMPWEKVIGHLEESQFSDPKTGYGYKGKSIRLSKGRKEILEQRVKEMRELAAISHGVTVDGKYMGDYNDRLVKMAYALNKTPFRELASAKSDAGLPLIYDTTANGFVQQPTSGDFADMHAVNTKAKETKAVNNQSLDSILQSTASECGVELGRTDDMFADQGKSTSLGTKANKLKVLELVGMGYSLSQIAAGTIPDLAEHIRERVANAAKEYLAKGGEDGAEFKADSDALMFRKAATMLFLRNAGLPNYDPRTQRLLCVRTESNQVINSEIKKHRGEVLPGYPRDSHASYSWFQTCTPTNANNLVAVSVPISRITSCDLFPNTKGKNLYNQFHRQETEVGVNAFGLPFVYLGKTEQLVPISTLFNAVSAAEKRSKKTLAGETIKKANDYARLSSPWARRRTGHDAAYDCVLLFGGL